MKTRSTLFTGISFALVLAGALFAAAQQSPRHPLGGGPPPFGMPFLGGRLADELALTDAQKTQIQAIITAEKTTIDPLFKQLATVRQQIDAAVADGQFDEAQVTALAAQQTTAATALTVEEARTKAKIYSVLTADQRAKLKTFQATHGRRGASGARGAESFSGAAPPSN